MIYTMRYDSPLGEILLAGDGQGLIGLWLQGQNRYAAGRGETYRTGIFSAYAKTKEWLDLYFSGGVPDFFPPIHLVGSPFRIDVWRALQKIPYGQTVTYGAIAKQMAKQRGVERISAQAVGGAVGHNPISIIVPCHRVIGSDGSLTGYAGGLARKARLLALEGAIPSSRQSLR